MKPGILFIETSDYESFPIGGQLAFARNMLKVFGNKIALVGAVADSTPLGRWMRKRINGIDFSFFPYIRITSGMHNKPLVPNRLQTYLAVKRHLSGIRSLGALNVFVQCPEILMAITSRNWESVCFRFPGVQAEMKYSRYPWARYLSRPFNYVLPRSLLQAEVILASACDKAIDELVSSSRGRLEAERIIFFPTRVDTDIFHPLEKNACRKKLLVPDRDLIIVSCTRLAWSKGWELLVDAFQHVHQEVPDSRLIFVGDGEDRSKLEKKAASLGLENRILITGAVDKAEVPVYLNAADVYAVSSFREGWSNSMLEALACARPIASTRVSGAEQMVVQGKNGYIVEERDPLKFARAVLKCLDLPEASWVSLELSGKYALKNLKTELSLLWSPLVA